MVLAISRCSEEKSKQRLRELGLARERIVRNVSTDVILDLLEEQSARAGQEGLFVLSIASPGFSARWQRHGQQLLTRR